LAWAGAAVSTGRPVLILDRENPVPIVRERLTRFAIEDGTNLRYWGGWLDQEAPLPGSSIVLDWIRTCGRKPLVTVDSLVAFHGGDENDAGQMRAFMGQCRKAADLGAAVLVLHHNGKAETAKDYRGSSDFKASVDVAFHVANTSSDSRLGTLRLRCFKSRFGFSGEIAYRYENGRFIREGNSVVPVRTAVERLIELVRENPGITAHEFEHLAMAQEIPQHRARRFLHEGKANGSVCVEIGERNTRYHTWREDSDE
jgi:hypothetical protein